MRHGLPFFVQVRHDGNTKLITCQAQWRAYEDAIETGYELIVFVHTGFGEVPALIQGPRLMGPNPYIVVHYVRYFIDSKSVDTALVEMDVFLEG